MRKCDNYWQYTDDDRLSSFLVANEPMCTCVWEKMRVNTNIPLTLASIKRMFHVLFLLFLYKISVMNLINSTWFLGKQIISRFINNKKLQVIHVDTFDLQLNCGRIYIVKDRGMSKCNVAVILKVVTRRWLNLAFIGVFQTSKHRIF